MHQYLQSAYLQSTIIQQYLQSSLHCGCQFLLSLDCLYPTLEFAVWILQSVFFFLITYMFLVALSPCCCTQVFSSCSEQGPLFVVMCVLLIVVASYAAEHGCQGTGAILGVHWLSCTEACGIFPDQGSNPCPLQRLVDSYPLHHQGSPSHIILMCVNITWCSYDNADSLASLSEPLVQQVWVVCICKSLLPKVTAAMKLKDTYSLEGKL